ncbi:hypothetical protein D5086_022762 [Populus alba]|uniref:Uncharacterized protein n=1 Tax=Populus alba TaxID=43335 RepID=A0ACC4B8I0_POPAL
MDTPHHLMSAQETCLPQKPPELDSMKETVIYSPKPQDISWRNNCLLASISAGVDYGKIQDDLISCDIQSTGMRSTGDIIGFDRLGLRRSALVSLRLLLSTRSDEDIRKTIILHIDGEEYTIHIDEIDSLHYPMAESICYSMDTFHSNLVLEDGSTTGGYESSSDGTIANFSVETTHDVGLDTGDKMKSFSNCEEAATDKPHLVDDTAYREASYSAPTRLQDNSSLVIINALQQLGGQVHFPTMSTDLFPEILGYTQNLNHHVSTTSNYVADVSKVQDSNVQAHHSVDLGLVTSGHPLMVEAQLSLGTYCSDSLDSTFSFSCSNYDLAHEPIQDTWPQTDEPSQPLKLGSTMYTNSRDLTQQDNRSMQLGDEEAIVSSEDREVQGMVQIGEALLIGDNSNLYAFEGDIRKQLQQEEVDWRAVQ